ncbi:MAG: beta-ketoacyl-[acyl-carrier-protein] synthase family protein [Ammonifex sp.]|jgi:3-oxoacyl-[acyl-carrier-protein] synthase II|nr:MAG: beta-ketoacyl-[acyl-carrier-protein] synthase family protein [Ammonifex sp.]
MRRRVVVTGLGAVTPLGTGKDVFWDKIKAGSTGIDRLTRFSTPPGFSKVAAEVKNLDSSGFLVPQVAHKMDRACVFAIISSILARNDAGLEINRAKTDRYGVFIGSSTGGIASGHEVVSSAMRKGTNTSNSSILWKYPPGVWSNFISVVIGIAGPSMTISSGCAAGTDAIGTAFQWIQSNLIDVAITGGTDAPIVPLNYLAFDIVGAMSRCNDEPQKACKPFDKERDGMVMGEGAGILILENLDHARARGAHIYAEVVGFGESCDAYHMSAPLPSGKEYARAMKHALENAGLEPRYIDYLNAHGSGTRLNDKTETLAIKECFKEHAYRLRISSIKGAIGHLFGGAGAVESIATVLAVQEDVIPPTANLNNFDPECDLNYVPRKAISDKISYAMKCSCGFGGWNKVLVFKKVG